MSIVADGADATRPNIALTNTSHDTCVHGMANPQPTPAEYRTPATVPATTPMRLPSTDGVSERAASIARMEFDGHPSRAIVSKSDRRRIVINVDAAMRPNREMVMSMDTRP
jgi:hypothetical protein